MKLLQMLCKNLSFFHNFWFSLSKLRSLGTATTALDKRLQSHIHMLRRNEGSFAGSNDVLEFDLAKSRSDKLVDVLNAKNTWTSVLRIVDMLGESEQNELFNYLVALQQANKILSQVKMVFESNYANLVCSLQSTRANART